jgi:exopolyphosphatase/guanosine-5'-triphosphate,3'-diphosphate pyrophosphatase
MIAIDLGSNTLRIIEYNGEIFGKSFEKIVRTAQGINQTGKIGILAQDKIIDGLHEAKNFIDFSNHEVVAVTTAAVRMASNATSFLKEIHRCTGVKFRIIDGNEEGKLTLLAVQNRLSLLKRDVSNLILVDIGGGSTEIVVMSEGEIIPKSFKFGIVTLSEEAPTYHAMQKELDSFGKSVSNYLMQFSNTPKTLVLTAGTPTTLVAYKLGMNYENYDVSRVNGAVLSKNDCNTILKALLELDEKQRAYFVGIGREELIIAGIRIVETIFDSLGFDEAVVVDDGLREGVALNYYL